MFDQLEEAKRFLLCGDMESARELYNKILKKDSKNLEALHGIGLSYFQEKKYQDAKEYLLRAVTVDASDPEIYNSLGIVCQYLHAWEEALVAFNHARRCYEKNPESFNELKYFKILTVLAEISIRQQKYAEARDILKIILRKEPDYVEALKMLAQAYVGLGRYYNAIQTLEKFVTDPIVLEALKVEIFQLKRDYRNAEKCAEKCVKLDPSRPRFYSMLGDCYIKTLKLEKSIEAFKKGLALDPCHFGMLGHLLAVQVRVCDWKERGDTIGRIRSLCLSDQTGECLKAIHPTIAILAGFSNQELLQVASAHSKAIDEAAAPLRQRLNFVYKKASPSKLRIGYLSSDFHNHATLHLMQDVFALQDRKKFEVYAYSYGGKDRSQFRKRLEADCDSFVDIRTFSDAEAAEQINQDKVDILVDLKGHIADHRLGILALRPAPVQIHYLGYPGTIGAPFIDYLVADKYVIPESERNFYSESIVYMPLTYQANNAQKTVQKKTPTKRQYGLPEEGFIFCCFNQNDKFDPESVNAWMQILKAVPKSVLWFWGNYEGLKRKLDVYGEEHGIEADRFIVSPSEGVPKHLARMTLADLFLDTFKYSAHTSCSDAIWVGLPVLTYPEKTFASRVAASLLTIVGAEELIAKSRDDYIAKAIDFARNPKKLKAIQAKIISNKASSHLYDPVQFTGYLDQAYLQIWKQHLKGGSKKDIIL